MKKALSGILILSTLTSFALANDIYVGAGVSIEDADVANNGQAFELSIGTVMENNFGVEAKLTKTISPSDEAVTSTVTGEVDITTISIFATYNAEITPDFTLTPKLGFTNFKTNIELSDGVSSASGDDTTTSFTFGLDAKYSITPNTKLYIGYTKYDPEFKGLSFDANQIAFGVQQSF